MDCIDLVTWALFPHGTHPLNGESTILHEDAEIGCPHDDTRYFTLSRRDWKVEGRYRFICQDGPV